MQLLDRSKAFYLIVRIRLPYYLLELIKVSTRFLWGSLLLPILFLSYNAPLINQLIDKYADIIISAYINNVAIIVTSNKRIEKNRIDYKTGAFIYIIITPIEGSHPIIIYNNYISYIYTAANIASPYNFFFFSILILLLSILILILCLLLQILATLVSTF